MSPLSNPPREPVAPFEWWQDRPLIGRCIERPVVCLGEHHILREQFFRGSPELTSMLSAPGRIGYAIDGHPLTSVQDCLARYFARAAQRCESNGVWPAGLAQGPAFAGYLRALTAQIPAVFCVDADAMRIDVLTLPTPIAPTECYYVALCRPRELPSTVAPGPAAGPVPPPAGRRLLTLEKTFRDATACVCEWTPDGAHRNLGEVSGTALPQFLGEVCRLLGIAAPRQGLAPDA